MLANGVPVDPCKVRAKGLVKGRPILQNKANLVFFRRIGGVTLVSATDKMYLRVRVDSGTGYGMICGD